MDHTWWQYTTEPGCVVAMPSRFVYVHSIMFAQRNRLTTHFSEHIPLAKWCMTIFLFKSVATGIFWKQMVALLVTFWTKMLYSLVTLCVSAPCSSPPVRWSFCWALGIQGYTCCAAAGDGPLPHFIQVSTQMLSQTLKHCPHFHHSYHLPRLFSSEHLSFSDNTRFLVSFPIKCKFQVGRHFVFSFPYYNLCLPHIIGVH